MQGDRVKELASLMISTMSRTMFPSQEAAAILLGNARVSLEELRGKNAQLEFVECSQEFLRFRMIPNASSLITWELGLLHAPVLSETPPYTLAMLLMLLYGKPDEDKLPEFGMLEVKEYDLKSLPVVDGRPDHTQATPRFHTRILGTENAMVIRNILHLSTAREQMMGILQKK